MQIAIRKKLVYLTCETLFMKGWNCRVLWWNLWIWRRIHWSLTCLSSTLSLIHKVYLVSVQLFSILLNAEEQYSSIIRESLWCCLLGHHYAQQARWAQLCGQDALLSVYIEQDFSRISRIDLLQATVKILPKVKASCLSTVNLMLLFCEWMILFCVRSIKKFLHLFSEQRKAVEIAVLASIDCCHVHCSGRIFG